MKILLNYFLATQLSLAFITLASCSSNGGSPPADVETNEGNTTAETTGSTTGVSSEQLQVRRVQLQTAERLREYYLYEPVINQNNDSPQAVVLVMHGGGGTAQGAIEEIGDTMLQLAEQHGFYVVFPEAINKLWDFGAGMVSEDLDERVDDPSYFSDLLDDLQSRLPIDTNRIFVTGISRGGQASYFIACQLPGRIRAIAPAAMPLPVYMSAMCETGLPVGVAIMNGTEDPIVPYNGGAITIGNNRRDEVLSTTQTIEFWANRNGCDLDTTVQSTIDPIEDQMVVNKTEWRSCSGAPVILYSIAGGGHTWPSGDQYLPKFIIGEVNHDIDGAEVAWEFFQEFK